jgi:peroxiredoxin Q/BCP
MRRLLALAATLLLATPSLATLPVGAKAPDFTTRGAVAGKVMSLHLAEQLKRGPVVLYFFPAAFTGGCNAEAHAFSEAVADFKAAGATVIGMSADDVPTLQRFSTANLPAHFSVEKSPAAPAM